MPHKRDITGFHNALGKLLLANTLSLRAWNLLNEQGYKTDETHSQVVSMAWNLLNEQGYKTYDNFPSLNSVDGTILINRGTKLPEKNVTISARIGAI